jgi:nicotinate-nucleotide adenylyltransferase
MSLAPRPIGILGGTFDPIHYGHLRPALEVLETLELAEIRFVPCRIPAHRAAPLITAEQRLALVRLATAEQPGFIADDRELRREGPSYMVDTLASLRADGGDDMPLCLILGADAFRELHTWHRWQRLSLLAHIIVMQRPGDLPPLPPVLEEFITPRRVHDAWALRRNPAGSILFQRVTQLYISATQIRSLLACGQSPRYLLPEAVLASIRDQALYLDATG